MRKKWVLCNILGVMERIIQSTHLVLSFRERRVAQGTVRGVNCETLSFELEMPKKKQREPCTLRGPQSRIIAMDLVS